MTSLPLNLDPYQNIWLWTKRTASFHPIPIHNRDCSKHLAMMVKEVGSPRVSNKPCIQLAGSYDVQIRRNNHTMESKSICSCRLTRTPDLVGITNNGSITVSTLLQQIHTRLPYDDVHLLYGEAMEFQSHDVIMIITQESINISVIRMNFYLHESS